MKLNRQIELSSIWMQENNLLIRAIEAESMTLRLVYTTIPVENVSVRLGNKAIDYVQDACT